MASTREQAGRPRSRFAGAVGSAWAALMGVLPHVLHHVGPLAGAALVAGTTGTVVFGLVAFVFTIPLLLRVRKRCGSWRIPALLLAAFIGVWSLSTWAVGPWVNGRFEDGSAGSKREPAADEAEHERHHEGVRNP